MKNLGPKHYSGSFGPKAIQALDPNFTLAADTKPYVQYKNSTFILALHTCEEYRGMMMESAITDMEKLME